VKLNGWAIECRINAEDPLRNFLPSVGRLVKYLPPQEQAGALRVDTGVFEGGEIPIHYDSLIAKLICHGATRDAAIARMRDALNAFVIRGVSSNIAFQAALMQHPRFVAGEFNTGFMAEEFPRGFHAANLVHEDPLLLASVAAVARLRYITRAYKVTGQFAGRERTVGRDWVVLMGARQYALQLTPIAGGYSISYDGETRELISDWKLGELLFHGTCNGERICLQIERRGLKYRIIHCGTQAEAMVMTARDAHLHSLMPEKPAQDLSKLLLSPMPGLVASGSSRARRKPARNRVIEAMKMENILRATRPRRRRGAGEEGRQRRRRSAYPPVR
jgi:propionyl-CoA carboxylase alpha chain